MTGMHRSGLARLFDAHPVRIDRQPRLRFAAIPRRRDWLRARSPSLLHLFDQGLDLRVGGRGRTLSLETRLQLVRQAEPFFARRRGEAAEGADHVLAGTLGSVHGLDEPIVGVGFSLVRLGGPTEVHRPL